MIINLNYGEYAQLPIYIGPVFYQDYSIFEELVISPTPADRIEIIAAENRYELVAEEDRFSLI